MRNVHLWRPSKFVSGPEGLAASSDPKEVSVSSRIAANLIAKAYWTAISDHAVGTLLDVGCGKIPLFLVYRNLVKRAVAVDWMNSLHPSPHIDVYADLNQGIPFGNNCFDTIIATDILEHLGEPRLFWNEVSRVLMPGGKLILGVPFLYWLHEEPHDHHRFTRYNLISCCLQNGLTILCLETYGGPLAVILDIVGKAFVGPSCSDRYQWLGDRILRSRVGKRYDSRKREKFPLGYCLVAQKTRELG